MLREPKGARRLNDLVTLTLASVTEDDYGHPSLGESADVLTVRAYVRQMSATKTMLTFQQADVVGVDLEFRVPGVRFNGITWRGHAIHFPTPEVLDNRGRVVRVSGWFQVDNPVQAAPTAQL